MFWVDTPYFLVFSWHVWTSSIIGLVIEEVWHMNKYLIFHNSRFFGQLVAFLDLILDKSVCWETCEYQSGRELSKLVCDKIWGHLA
jgi:hypothetical protein